MLKEKNTLFNLQVAENLFLLSGCNRLKMTANSSSLFPEEVRSMSPTVKPGWFCDCLTYRIRQKHIELADRPKIQETGSFHFLFLESGLRVLM